MANLKTINNFRLKILLGILAAGILFFIWKYNHKIFFLINGLYNDVLGYPMIFLTAMADGLFVLMISAALYPKKKGFYWSFIISYLISTIIVNLIKNYYSTGRPLAYYSMEEIFYAGEILKAQSFPSGHSAAAMVLCRYLAQGVSKKLSAAIYAVGFLCAVSRIYIGVHFPFDVAVGAAIGFFVTNGVFLIAEKKYGHSSRPEYRYNQLLISIIGLSAGIFYLFYGNERYAPLSMVINVTALLFSIFFLVSILRLFFKIYRNRAVN